MRREAKRRKLVGCAVVFLALLLPAWTVAQNGGSTNVELTFDQRVSCQRAIEEVYWRHRLWPAESTLPKPAFDEVTPGPVLRQKVETSLFHNHLLKIYWQRPITSDQLEAEIRRMAGQTRQPEVLQELFSALHNDPHLVAECLARPVLAERLVTTLFAAEERVHGELRRRAETELTRWASSQDEQGLTGRANVTELVEVAEGAPDPCTVRTVRALDATVVEERSCFALRPDEFAARAGKLVALMVSRPAPDPTAEGSRSSEVTSAGEALAALAEGTTTGLLEDEHWFYATRLLSRSDGRVKTATIEWPKVALDSWLETMRSQSDWKPEEVALGLDQRAHSPLPAPRPAGASAGTDSWASMVNGVIEPDDGKAVWTGSEMIVWGGAHPEGSSFKATNKGCRYDPATDTWRGTSLAGAPEARKEHSLVWTGRHVIVWGGSNRSYDELNTGGRYDPAIDTWQPTTTVGAPGPRNAHSAVWTGSEMIVWGGDGYPDPGVTGGRYDPVADRWTATSTASAPTGRYGHTAIWTGAEMVVWSGYPKANTGGRYNPTTDTWRAVTTTGAPSQRSYSTAIWTGTEMIVWGGSDTSYNHVNSGGRYRPDTDTWTATSTSGAPGGRYDHVAVWTGTEMIIWGGWLGKYDGGRYNPTTDSWTPMATTGAPRSMTNPFAVWSGHEVIVWGWPALIATNDGGRYNPTSDTWTPFSPPTMGPRMGHRAVWTGTEMLVWGGGVVTDECSVFGGRYEPALDNWRGMTASGSPEGCFNPAATWSGQEMIIWGGASLDGTTVTYYSSGARFDPTSGAWSSMGTAGLRPRVAHSMVWAGSEAVVWGGWNVADGSFADGARYNPATNLWAGLPSGGAPSARKGHSAVWTGSEMLIWGGGSNTGARFRLASDDWAPTSTSGAPSSRSSQSAVWTGREMVVWGGISGTTPVSSGGRYDPTSDTWLATNETGAPSPRGIHSTVWTGSEMIVWGGDNGTTYFDTGGRYSPGTDSWTAMTSTSAPKARNNASAVWTGSEMIVWGGYDGHTELEDGGRYRPPVLPPTASFTFSPASPLAGRTVQFSDTSTAGPTTWWWSFGDGSTASSQNPSHVYAAAGSYTVKLTASNENGSSSASATITVRPAVSGSANLALTLADEPDPVAAGGAVIYTVSVRNNGPDTADHAEVTDTLGSATLVSATASQGSCAQSGHTITCALGSLANGSSASIVVIARTGQAGSLANQAMATADQVDPDPSNNSAQVTTSVSSSSYRYLVPAAANVAGAAGSQWRCDLAVVNQGSAGASMSLVFYPSASAPLGRSATLAAGATNRWRDIVGSLFGVPGTSGSLEVVATAPLAVVARSYNQATTGTFGQYYPACTEAFALTQGRLGVLPNLEKSAGFRTNVGVLNLGTATCTVQVRLINAQGTQVGSPKTMTVDPARWLQQYDIFAATGAGSQDIAYAVVEVQTDGGKVWVYAALVDMKTNDPTTIPLIIQP